MVGGMDEFHARDGMIRLGQLLKAAGLVETGGEAKLVLGDGRGDRQRRGRDAPRPPAAPRRRRRARRRVRAPDLKRSGP